MVLPPVPCIGRSRSPATAARCRRAALRAECMPALNTCRILRSDDSVLATRAGLAHAEAIEEEALQAGDDPLRGQVEDPALIEVEVDGERGEDGVGQIVRVERRALAIGDGATEEAEDHQALPLVGRTAVGRIAARAERGV